MAVDTPDEQVSTEETRELVASAPVLCVDVDGTLLRTDLLFESFLYLAKQKPWLLVLVPIWLARGKAHLKQRLAQNASVAGVSFPFHAQLLQFLQAESAGGKRLILCSGSDSILVNGVASQLGFPVDVMASDGTLNLKGQRKAEALVERFGPRGFDYAGNASEDLPVWNQARYAIVVDASPQVEKDAKMQGNVSMVLPRTRNPFSAFLRAVRPHQWVKNTLVFVPLIASHNFSQPSLILNALAAFFSISLCASSVYIVNDLGDIESDRKHLSKKHRPFASGELSIQAGLIAAPLLLGLGIAISLLLPWMATNILFAYLALSTAYTFWLKRKLLADIVTLSLLYTIRIVLGGAATGSLVSPWLLAFSLFLFISLAFNKRVAEMISISTTDGNDAPGRGYFVPDITTLASLGTASGYLACLVLSLYINGENSESVKHLYSHPAWLWLLLPLLLNWIGRIWVVTMRGRMSQDPIVYLLRDRATYLTIVFGAVILLLATKCPFPIPGIQE